MFFSAEDVSIFPSKMKLLEQVPKTMVQFAWVNRFLMFFSPKILNGGFHTWGYPKMDGL